MIDTKRTVVSVVVSVLLVATAIASMWLMASAGVFSGAEQPLPAAPDRGASSPAVEESSGTTAAIAAGFQAAQPRNPFEPLVDPLAGSTTTTLDDESSTTTAPDDGSTTTTTTGDSTTTTTAGATTTTTSPSDSPDGIRVALLEVREEDDALIAVVEVDDETSTVGVGDTFADNFKVVSLTESGGVFTFGDSAFTLSVGQSIYK